MQLIKLICFSFLVKDSRAVSLRARGCFTAQAILMSQVLYSSRLQRHCFDRRTNQGTPRLLREKIQNWSLKIFTKTINTPMARQENRWTESFEMMIFSPFSELTSEILWMLFTCEKLKLPWNQGWFGNVQKLSFWNQGWFQGWLEMKVKFMSCLKNQGCFQNVPEFPFYIYSSFHFSSK